MKPTDLLYLIDRSSRCLETKHCEVHVVVRIWQVIKEMKSTNVPMPRWCWSKLHGRQHTVNHTKTLENCYFDILYHISTTNSPIDYRNTPPWSLMFLDFTWSYGFLSCADHVVQNGGFQGMWQTTVWLWSPHLLVVKSCSRQIELSSCLRTCDQRLCPQSALLHKYQA